MTGFRHKHPGDCAPCGGWGFVLDHYWLLDREAFLRCRACRGTGWL